VEVELHAFLTSALGGGEWTASRSGRLIPMEGDPGAHWIRGCVEARAGLYNAEKRPGPRLEPSIIQSVAQRYTNGSY